MIPYEIRQLSDGSIDYNKYYARPVVLTTPAMRRFLRTVGWVRGAAIAAATLTALLVVAHTSDARFDCAHCAALVAAR